MADILQIRNSDTQFINSHSFAQFSARSCQFADHPHVGVLAAPLDKSTRCEGALAAPLRKLRFHVLLRPLHDGA